MRAGRRHGRQNLDRVSAAGLALVSVRRASRLCHARSTPRSWDSPSSRAIRPTLRRRPTGGAIQSNRTRLVAISFLHQIRFLAAPQPRLASAFGRFALCAVERDPLPPSQLRARAEFRRTTSCTSAGDIRASLAERMAWIMTPKTRSKPTSIEKEAKRPSLWASTQVCFQTLPRRTRDRQEKRKRRERSALPRRDRAELRR